MVLVVSSHLIRYLNFLVQNYIKLELDFFKIRLLDFLIQNVSPLPPLAARVRSAGLLLPLLLLLPVPQLVAATQTAQLLLLSS